MQPYLSVIIPVYNTGKYLRRCLDSVLTQSLTNIEIIIVNDASTGDEKSIIEEYQADSRVVYVEHENNKGLFHARLSGTEKASGEYVSFVDSDDFISVDYFHRMYKSAKKYNSDIVIGKTIKLYGEKNFFVNIRHEEMFKFDVLYGEKIRKRFYEQHGYCFAWQTIWNKIYKKSLWDRCSIYYEQITEHLIMTEDIAFSVPIFYFAETISTIPNDGYFYCENEDSATANPETVPDKQFLKKLSDLTRVFDFCTDFLRKQKGSESYLKHFGEFRKYYARMWRRFAARRTVLSNDTRTALENFLPEYEEQLTRNDSFWGQHLVSWNQEFENIKKRIINAEQKYVSFDIFDTLIARPFWDPADLFMLLNNKFFALTGCRALFKDIRIEAENIARKKLAQKFACYQDITLDEIYDVLHTHYLLDKTASQILMEEEKKLELRYCRSRNTGKELFELAILAGKKIILASDMYLTPDFVESLLENCGYTGYDKLYVSSDVRLLKGTGEMYRHILQDLDVRPDDILHIGDNWHSDIVQANNAGISTIFLPSSKESFQGRINQMKHNCLQNIEVACGSLINKDDLLVSPGIRLMLGLVCMREFDNPFRSFDLRSSYTGSPSLMGYFPLGMHLVALCCWVVKKVKQLGGDSVTFLARDGLLLYNAFEVLSKIDSSIPQRTYKFVTRRSMLPATFSQNIDLLTQMPVNVFSHTYNSMIELLRFCCNPSKDGVEIEKMFYDKGICLERAIGSQEQFCLFLQLFIKHLYDSNLHEEERKITAEYVNSILKDSSIVFDLGYSARVISAMATLAEKPFTCLFVHSDSQRARYLETREKFTLECFYDFSPYESGILREFLFSDKSASCIGYRRDGDAVEPVFDKDPVVSVAEQFVLKTIQDGALDLLKDFWDIYLGNEEVLSFRGTDASLFFEVFLSSMTDIDLDIFSSSSSDDYIFNAKRDFNLKDFMAPRRKINQPATSHQPVSSATPQAQKVVFSERSQDKPVEITKLKLHGNKLVFKAR